MQASESLNIVCQRIRLSGLVQGVGFRPFVWRLAKELNLTGWVRKDNHGLEIEVCGDAEQVQNLIERLQDDAPSISRIDSVLAQDTVVECVAEDFYILNSLGGRAAAMIAPDTAVCRDCLAEMFDPANRRWRHAFASCSNCGPRYSVCRALPFTRERSSLKPFTPCPKCQNEYRRTGDRRHHNEVNCCPKCGPELALLDGAGRPLPGDPIAQALALLAQGKIVAIKDLGGFHLACDARNAKAVAELRQRKQRDEKPFSVMLANASSASTFVQLGVGEPGLLAMPERPIILLKKRSSCDAALPGVASGLGWLGVMMPCTPLQYLLFHAAAGSPEGLGWLDLPQKLALVMISADPGDEPLIIDNDDALQRLSEIADAFLLHGREIMSGCNDSVARSGPGGLKLVRRAGGYTPRAIKLPRSGPPVLAVGGRFKNTVCLTRGDEAFVSQHIGDLDNVATCDFFDATITRLLKFIEIKPALIAHDFDRDFHSTHFALDFAHQRGVPALAVQHHHAHVASVLAEHRVDAPVIALALDGVGLGADGGDWGGELLRVDGAYFERLGHLAPLQLADQHAIREPWRLAAAVLQQLGRGQEIEQRFAQQLSAASVNKTLEGGAHCPQTSSLGCYINAAASLLGVKSMMAFDGQAASLLEGLAERYGDILPVNDGWTIKDGCLNLLPLFSILADEKDPGRGAAIFHATLVAALSDWVYTVAPANGTIVGSGACFLNMILARGLRSRLGGHGLHLIEARRLPPNDGGLALGQAWIAQQYLLGKSKETPPSAL
ncbi:carbamoyltransferase HypF [Propionivibrio sp.]|uniref:carbamoyltransferase HypF n=1 Tax=Propionivibrio sp. TaxID=2212460 RepID=UPI00263756F2|nr:carbamoyltransferase HypF [Propionivibrio sp.]